MIEKKVFEIINKSKKYGWVLEPDAKYILSEYNISLPSYKFAKNIDEAIKFVREIHYPIVCKVVSPEIIHKSDVGGVIVGIENDEQLKIAFEKLSKLKGFLGVIVEKMVKGIELIVGAKNDEQFGPVVLIGMGGVAVEIYKDTAIRMAPLSERDINSMIASLKCYPLLKGYRGAKGINIDSLVKMLEHFSKMIMDLKENFLSIDLNPVMCSENECYVADARIMLKNH